MVGSGGRSVSAGGGMLPIGPTRRLVGGEAVEITIW